LSRAGGRNLVDTNIRSSRQVCLNGVRPPRVLFLGTAFAGWKTRFLNLKAHSEQDSRIHPAYRVISGWQPGGRIERLPLPQGVSGRLRSALEAAPFATIPRPDVIWLGGVSSLIAPYLWGQLGGLRRPLVCELDWTLEQQEAFAPFYYRRPPRQGLPLILARLQERLIWRNVSLFTPWSTWAADALRRQGVGADRIQVVHPGVDLSEWPVRPREDARSTADRLRLLFVGSDFERKGGQILLDVFRARFADRCELDLVTPASISPSPDVRVHRAEPNSARLHELYARADLLVLPTQADCFGLVAVEALATGLPVIMTNVGGVSDIIDHAETGWLMDRGGRALSDALEHALKAREQLPAMGRRGRAVAEARFDGAVNDRHLVDLIIDQAARRNGR